MPRIFKHLTRTDRLRIEKCLNEGYTYRQIADVLRVHISTIYREIKKGEYQRLNGATYEFYPAYSPDIAEERYQANLSAKGADLKIGNDHEFAAYIQNKIKYEKRSPAAALADIALEGRTFKTSVCVTTIYSYISKGVFASLTDSDLPDKPKRHRKAKENKKGSRPPRGESIEKRPEIIDNREEFGHWEMDTVYSAAETSLRALLVLTERKTRKEIIIVMPDRTAKSTVLALNRLERRFGAKFRKIFKSITVDNGTEFSDLEGMKKSILYSGLRTKFYYCHPYSSWERGSNENLNRMIRRKFPKGTSFADVTRKQVQNVEDWMNNYPRKVLGYLTAEMAYQTCVAAL